MATWTVYCSRRLPGICDEAWSVIVTRSDLPDDAPCPQHILAGYACPPCGEVTLDEPPPGEPG